MYTIWAILQNQFGLIRGNGTNYVTSVAASDLNINFDIKDKAFYS